LIKGYFGFHKTPLLFNRLTVVTQFLLGSKVNYSVIKRLSQEEMALKLPKAVVGVGSRNEHFRTLSRKVVIAACLRHFIHEKAR
jgi:hypothetical protein